MARNLQLHRRAVLRGLGTAIALPLLEAMLPRIALSAAAAPAKSSPRRMVFCYVPNGMHMPDWTPKTEGANFELPPILEPLKPHRSELTILSQLTLDGARPHGDGGGDHARSVAAYLTGAHPRKTDGSNIENGISVDQFAAEKIGDATRFPSLELGCEGSALSGNCDSGYSCAYSSNVAWRNATTPVPKENNPQDVFDRLFGVAKNGESASARKLRGERRQSVLDFVKEDAASLRRNLGHADQRKVDEYLHSVRDVEKRLARTEKLDRKEIEVPDYPRPEGAPREIGAHVRLMFDMIRLALQTDSTRIITFMYTNDGSNRSYPELGVKSGHHDISHHKNDPEKHAQIAKINRFHVEQLAYFVASLREVREGENTLLDNCFLMYGSGISDGDRHNHDDLPIALLGRGGGAIAPGRHLKFDSETPLCNLYVSMLREMGVSVDRFGDSTGPLPKLGGA